jgi:hypothetical protein
VHARARGIRKCSITGPNDGSCRSNIGNVLTNDALGFQEKSNLHIKMMPYIILLLLLFGRKNRCKIQQGSQTNIVDPPTPNIISIKIIQDYRPPVVITTPPGCPPRTQSVPRPCLFGPVPRDSRSRRGLAGFPERIPRRIRGRGREPAGNA